MIHPKIFFIAITIVTLVQAGHYEHVQFFNRQPIVRIPHKNFGQLTFSHPLDDWSDEFFPFSSGFDVSDLILAPFVVDDGPYNHFDDDPFLLTGEPARRAARVLYRKELFFDDIPHLRAMNYNQNLRVKNGLPPHKMGSLRPSNPWYRRS